MRKLLVGSALVVAIGIGSLGVAALNPVGAVSAAVAGHTKSGDKAGPLSDALDELVANGTITQDQANAVEGSVQAKRQAVWAKRPHLGKKLVEGIANDLNMAPKDLMTELRSGKSIANVATDKGVDPQKVIDDVVGAIDGKIDQRVAGKKLDQDRADAMKQNLPQRVTDFVNRVWGQGKAKASGDQQTPSTYDDHVV
ncbi:MAG: hypothetical protein ACXV8G_09535, partial [Acidimicrobiales bacterium]